MNVQSRERSVDSIPAAFFAMIGISARPASSSTEGYISLASRRRCHLVQCRSQHLAGRDNLEHKYIVAFGPNERGRGSPDTEVIRTARHNTHYHLAYIGRFVARATGCHGERVSCATLAAPEGSIKSIELAKFVKLRPRRAETVDRVIAVAVADSHSAEQHLLGRKFQERADNLVEAYPSHLRTGVQPIAPRQ